MEDLIEHIRHCPLCGWKGPLEECDIDLDDNFACPLCGYNDLEEIDE